MQNKELKSTYYQVYLESFLDSNDDGIGDINGLASKMSILGQVGFNYVFVSKIFGKKDGKTDFSQINPILGDEKLSLIHISEPTRPCGTSRMPSSA